MPNFTLPVKPPIDGPYKWDKFGVVRPLDIDPRGKPHDGLDLRSKTSHDVFAVDDGRVVVNTDAMGSYIAIDHDGGYRSIYAHLIERLPPVGTYIKKGQKIGVYGVIGLSTGAHLHFMIRKNGVAIDPEPLIFNSNNQNIMSPQELLNTLRKEKVDLTNIKNGQDWGGRLQGLINEGKIDSFYSELFDILKWSQNKVEYIDDPRLKEKIEELEVQLAEAPQASIKDLEAKQEEIDQLKQALDEKTQELNKIETDRMRVYNQLQELENKPEPKSTEKFDWNKFLVGLSKDQTFQRGLRHTVTFAIGVLASQFPEYAPYILGLAGVWGLGTEVQAFQVNQKQIVKEKK
jgi:hypothetical protein